jgi:hypothetical protein
MGLVTLHLEKLMKTENEAPDFPSWRKALNCKIWLVTYYHKKYFKPQMSSVTYHHKKKEFKLQNVARDLAL